MKLAIRHTTRYHYTEPLRHSVQTLHLWPASHPSQAVVDWRITAPGRLHAQPDGLGNRVHSLSWLPDGEHEVCHLNLVAEGVVRTHGVAEFTDPASAPHPSFYLRSTPHAEPHPRMATWARALLPAVGGRAGDPTPDGLVALAQAVAERVRYRPGRTGVETTALEAFDWGLGVCQDQAHVMVAVCRSLGWPARYVSGYFFAEDAPELASHAWVDVCLDTATRRWLSLDVTHGGPIDERHVRLAAGSDYTACPPVKGIRRGGGVERLTVEVCIGRAPGV